MKATWACIGAILMVMSLWSVAGCAAAEDAATKAAKAEQAASQESAAPPDANGAREAKTLFERCRRASGRELETRMKAAGRLAKAADGEEWIVLALADPTALHGHVAPEHEIPESLAQGGRAVIARILENLPADTNDPVLFAVTRLLRETRWGAYSTFEGISIGKLDVLGKMGQGSTEPLRNLAQEALKRAMGVDHGYDAEAWRQEILKRDFQKNSNKAENASQP